MHAKNFIKKPLWKQFFIQLPNGNTFFTSTRLNSQKIAESYKKAFVYSSTNVPSTVACSVTMAMIYFENITLSSKILLRGLVYKAFSVDSLDDLSSDKHT